MIRDTSYKTEAETDGGALVWDGEEWKEEWKLKRECTRIILDFHRLTDTPSLAFLGMTQRYL